MVTRYEKQGNFKSLHIFTKTFLKSGRNLETKGRDL